MKISDLNNHTFLLAAGGIEEAFPTSNDFPSGKEFLEEYIGLFIHRTGFYGIIKPDKSIIALPRNSTNFNFEETITIEIDGHVELRNVPFNTGGIVYHGIGILEVNGTVIYNGYTGGSASTASWGSISGNVEDQVDLVYFLEGGYLSLNGTNSPSTNIDWGGFSIENISSVSYSDGFGSGYYLDQSGLTFLTSGSLNNITTIYGGSGNSYISVSSGALYNDLNVLIANWSGNNLSVNADPINPLDVATKQYVDSMSGGGSYLPLSAGAYNALTGDLYLGSGILRATGMSSGNGGRIDLVGGTLNDDSNNASGRPSLDFINRAAIGTSGAYAFNWFDGNLNLDHYATTAMEPVAFAQFSAALELYIALDGSSSGTSAPIKIFSGLQGPSGEVFNISGTFTDALYNQSIDLSARNLYGNTGALVASWQSGNFILQHDATQLLEAVTYQQFVAALSGISVTQLQQGHDASTGLFPSASNTSPLVSSVKKGMYWYISTPGTIGGRLLQNGDTLIALVNSPGQTFTNWLILEHDLSYTPLSNSVNSAYIIVGNSSNIGTPVALSQDGLLSNTGGLTITGIQNKAIALATGFLKYNGSAFVFDNSTYLTTSTAGTTYQPLEDQRLSTTNSPSFVGYKIGSTLVLGQSSGNIYFQTPGASFIWNNAAGSAQNMVLSNAGALTVAGSGSFGGAVTGADLYANAATAPTVFWGSSMNLSRRGTGIASLGNGTRDDATGTLLLGNIGINTTTITERLNINGYSLATGYKVPSGTATQFLKANGTIDTNAYIASPGNTAGYLYNDGTGVLSWATVSGGGGTIGGSIAAKQIAYGSASNAIAGNTNFVYDSINGWVGLGVTTPLSILHIVDNSVSAVRGLLMDNNSSGMMSSRYITRKSRSGGVITTGDVLGSWVSSGHDGTGYIEAADIRMISTGTILTNKVPGQIMFRTATSAGTLTQALLIDTDQSALFSGGVFGNYTSTATGTFTMSGGATVASSFVITVTSTAGLQIGDGISGTGIPANSYVIGQISSTTFMINAATTATNSGLTITVQRAQNGYKFQSTPITQANSFNSSFVIQNNAPGINNATLSLIQNGTASNGSTTPVLNIIHNGNYNGNTFLNLMSVYNAAPSSPNEIFRLSANGNSVIRFSSNNDSNFINLSMINGGGVRFDSPVNMNMATLGLGSIASTSATVLATSTVGSFSWNPSSGANTFTWFNVPSSVQISSTGTASGFAYMFNAEPAVSGFVGSTTNKLVAFRANIPTGANRYGFLSLGTADNAFLGNTIVGSVTPATSTFQVAGSFSTAFINTSSSITLDATNNTVTVDASGAARTITLPTAVGISGRVYNIKKIDSSANTVTIATTSSQTIDGITTKVLTAQYQSYSFISDGSNWLIF